MVLQFLRLMEKLPQPLAKGSLWARVLSYLKSTKTLWLLADRDKEQRFNCSMKSKKNQLNQRDRFLYQRSNVQNLVFLVSKTILVTNYIREMP